MDYQTLTALLQQETPKVCVCCNERIKGRPRTTHAGNDWKIYCLRCYRDCRPYPNKTGCFDKGGVNLDAKGIAAAHRRAKEIGK